MISFKASFNWCYGQLCIYNLFVNEENDDDDDGDERRDKERILKQQKYTTWLYIILLMVSLYIVFYIALTKQQSSTITEANIDFSLFNQLYREHGENLSCPCSTIAIPLKHFVSHTIKFHPICSSIFISEEWIKAIYFKEESRYGIGDFRTIACSQFQLLASLCSFFEETVLQSRIDFDNIELINDHPLLKAQVEAKVNATIESTIIQANYLVSALNTNVLVVIAAYPAFEYLVSSTETSYTTNSFASISDTKSLGCSDGNPMSTPSYLNLSTLESYEHHWHWSRSELQYMLPNGFLTGCTPFEALLESTLDCLYNTECLNTTEMKTMTTSDPTLNTYKNLQVQYSILLKCPCSNIIIPHKTFISLSPRFHQVCSSDFVTPEWLSLLKMVKIGYNSPDWRNHAYSQFRLLADLCKLSEKTINVDVQRFLSQSFIASEMLSEIDFNAQFNVTLDQLFKSTSDYFDLLIQTVRLIIQVDQPYFGPQTIPHTLSPENNPMGIFKRNTMTDRDTVKLKFRLTGSRGMGHGIYGCACATNKSCQSSVRIYDIDYIWTMSPIYIPRYTVRGAVAGCSATDSLMLSTLECYYSRSDCLSTLMNYTKQQYFQNVEHSAWFDVRPLNDSVTSRFSPKAPISTIVEKVMIEQWYLSHSYDNFYNSCAPHFCTYTQRVSTNTYMDILITLLSMIGGLNLSIQLITPQLIMFIFYIVAKIKGRNQKRNQNQRQDPQTAKRLGQWATRLYLASFFTGLVVLSFYTIVQSRTVTETFEEPPYKVYKQLFQRYTDKLKCPCSTLASTYDRCVKMEAELHQICSSPFVSDEGQRYLIDSLVSDLTVYALNDYRRFLPAHLQLLKGLCELSHEAISIFKQQLLSSLFVTSVLLSETNLDAHLNSIINQNTINASTTFTGLLFLIRSINHGNRMISTYGTNFEYIIPWKNVADRYAPTNATIYDHQCSCALYSNCTTAATLIKANSSETIQIKGLKMGCIPSESFRLSTLECFYDQSCLNLIYQYTNHKVNPINLTNPLSALSRRTSRFSINSTVNKLIDELFIEQWKITNNHRSYFEQCSPLLCSYTYIERYNLLHTLSVLFGLQGGLSLVLQWICPKLIKIIDKMYQYRNRQLNIIQPVSSIETVFNENSNTNDCHSTLHYAVISVDKASEYVCLISIILLYNAFLY
ncbi:hypothetical protein I4U23_027576 [Adineta vaga]|nr:hypothetical protein I4U23_027576 [Adineta vaga]